MDFIRDLFRHCNPGGVGIGRTRLAEPTSWTVPAGDDFLTGFVFVAQGSPLLRSSVLRAAVTLHPGDLLVMVRGLDYEIEVPGPNPQVYRTMRIPPSFSREDAPPLATLITGGFRFTDAPLDGGLVDLPRHFIVRAAHLDGDTQLAGAVHLIRGELERHNPVRDADIARLLLELFFTYALAHWQDRQANDARAVRDASIYRAVKLMHQDVAHPWSVIDLARASGLSRKVFMQRFRRSTGETPFGYLTKLRMDRARELLTTTRKPLRQIAGDVGYADAFAFSKAFKRREGRSPRTHRTVPDQAV